MSSAFKVLKTQCSTIHAVPTGWTQLWSPLSQQVLFSYLKLVSCLHGTVYNIAAGLCRSGCLSEKLPVWIKSCWHVIVNRQVPVLTSAAFPCVCVSEWPYLSVIRLYCKEAEMVCVLQMVKDRKGQMRDTETQRGTHWALESSRRLKHTGEAAAEKMRERINTFETVLNMDQFLVGLTTRWNTFL